MRNTVRKAVRTLAKRGDGWFATFRTQPDGSFQLLFNSDGSWDFLFFPSPHRAKDVQAWLSTSALGATATSGPPLEAHSPPLPPDQITDILVGFLGWYGAQSVEVSEIGCAAVRGTPKNRLPAYGCAALLVASPIGAWLLLYSGVKGARFVPAIIGLPALILDVPVEQLVLYAGGALAIPASAFILWYFLNDIRHRH